MSGRWLTDTLRAAHTHSHSCTCPHVPTRPEPRTTAARLPAPAPGEGRRWGGGQADGSIHLPFGFFSSGLRGGSTVFSDDGLPDRRSQPPFPWASQSPVHSLPRVPLLRFAWSLSLSVTASPPQYQHKDIPRCCPSVTPASGCCCHFFPPPNRSWDSVLLTSPLFPVPTPWSLSEWHPRWGGTGEARWEPAVLPQGVRCPGRKLCRSHQPPPASRLPSWTAALHPTRGLRLSGKGVALTPCSQLPECLFSLSN